MSNEMIERVAKAIGNIRSPDLANYRDQRLVAMVAIEAMREPTEAMASAACWTDWPHPNIHGEVSEEKRRNAGAEIYSAMIDAALAIRATPVSEREEG